MLVTAWHPAPEGLAQILQLLRVISKRWDWCCCFEWVNWTTNKFYFQESQSPDTVTQRTVQRRLEELNQVSFILQIHTDIVTQLLAQAYQEFRYLNFDLANWVHERSSEVAKWPQRNPQQYLVGWKGWKSTLSSSFITFLKENHFWVGSCVGFFGPKS